jgi:hypothetical protein
VTDALRFPWDLPVTPVVPPTKPDPDTPAVRPKRRGRRRRTVLRPETADNAPAWRFHHLTVSGPKTELDAFAAAARGSGIIPWPLDEAALEDDIFARALAQPASRRTLTVAGCRILARQFRDKVAAHQAQAAALVGRSRACAFDLHALLPVPDAILQMGPTHPAALAWLAAHWGITDRLRQVNVRDQATPGRRLPAGHTVIGYSFFTDRETPDAAIRTIAARWPALRFRLVLRPLD